LLEVTETFTDMEPSSNFKIVRQSEGPYTCRK
jgi:hypothetical protein